LAALPPCVDKPDSVPRSAGKPKIGAENSEKESVFEAMLKNKRLKVLARPR
jgi:hypothetical protein